MMDHQPHQNNNLSPAAVQLLSNVSGAYAAPFWDGLLEVTGSLDPIRAVRSAIAALNGCGKYDEAFHLVLALYDLAAIDIPNDLSELGPYPEGIAVFMDEFLLDTEDLLLDYEYADQHRAET
ncbi:MAG: hypothetical protein J1E06_09260 [Acutalibacter sp.]|nr:hypothetical protein [Acutalibacter sp.]